MLGKAKFKPSNILSLVGVIDGDRRKAMKHHINFDSEFSEKDQKNGLKALSDEALLAVSLENPDAFSELVDRYERVFVRKALSILGDEDDAYDVVQETFVRMYANARKFKKRKGASLSSWGYSILVNRCRSMYSRNKRLRTVSFEYEPALLEVIPDENAMRENEDRFNREYLMSLVSRLPELLRRVVVMHFLEGRPQKEIAERENVSGGAIRARIHRAKRELRKIDRSFRFLPGMAVGA